MDPEKEELTKEQEERMSVNSLICICLILGKLKQPAFTQVVSQIREHLQSHVLKQVGLATVNCLILHSFTLKMRLHRDLQCRYCRE
jgi:hypothetical protein